MRKAERVVVIGASGFGRESLDVLDAMKKSDAFIEIIGVIDDAPSEKNLERLEDRGISYLGTLENWLMGGPVAVRYVLGIGNPQIRRRVASRLDSAGLSPFTAVHPTAAIGEKSVLGPGAVVCAGAVISTNVRLERHVHVNPNATIGHDSLLGDYVSINPASVVSGEVKLGPGVLVGAAATILQNLSVGSGTIVGAAALVTKDIPDNVVVTGVPGTWKAI